MSQENVEVVRRSFDAWNDGDIEAIRGCHAEDVVVQTGITEFGKTFEGDEPHRALGQGGAGDLGKGQL
jgi:ketosteroid isomerase-like protein